MRPRADSSTGEKAAKAAERLADNPASWYGYWDIPRYVLPKLLLDTPVPGEGQGEGGGGNPAPKQMGLPI